MAATMRGVAPPARACGGRVARTVPAPQQTSHTLLHVTFRREWRPLVYEVGPAAPTPPVQIVCATPPGNVVNLDV